jgi:hypothetical protein
MSWKKDSHGLYDYENKDMKVEKNLVIKNSYIFRYGNFDIFINKILNNLAYYKN